jgi:hypothetical protein
LAVAVFFGVAVFFAVAVFAGVVGAIFAEAVFVVLCAVDAFGDFRGVERFDGGEAERAGAE